jgi:glycosyltransferase involved in cell wall biosynthesis
VAARLERFNGIASEPLYHPPPLAGRYRSGPPGDYVLSVGRLDAWKRPDLVVQALVHAPAARLVLLGKGPEEERLRRLAREKGVSDRVRFVAEVDDEGLIELYAGSRLVLVAPQGEDLGYVPLEAFLSKKAVLTTEDAGGALEFVENGKTGFVVEPRAEALGAALALAWERPEALAALGQAGFERASVLTWDRVVASLMKAAGLALP